MFLGGVVEYLLGGVRVIFVMRIWGFVGFWRVFRCFDVFFGWCGLYLRMCLDCKYGIISMVIIYVILCGIDCFVLSGG